MKPMSLTVLPNAFKGPVPFPLQPPRSLPETPFGQAVVPLVSHYPRRW